MLKLSATHRHSSRTPLLLSTLLAAPLALSATTITGTVTDGTIHKPASGDDVVLIALQQRMQEVARTKTDSKGNYSINLPDDGMHLIRVDHQKAAYFQPAPPGTTHVDVQVYDVAASVPGISTEANVFRAETDQQGLKVIQSYFIKNDSSPPRTQFSPRSYEIYLPAGAQVQGAAAMGPGGMPVASSPIPLGDPDHYAFVFPLRPGETQFQISYQLPYSGSLAFHPKLAMPADNLVVMLPKSMKFEPGAGTGFQLVDAAQAGQDPGSQTYVAKNVTPASALAYTISGQGSLPRESQDAQAGQNGAGAAPNTPAEGSAAAQADTRPGGGLGNPIDSPDPLNKYKWWILSGLAVAMAIAAGFLLRRPASAPLTGTALANTGVASGIGTALATPEPSTRPPNGTLSALKDELFLLETERAQGHLSEDEYTDHKRALEVVLKRALSRKA